MYTLLDACINRPDLYGFIDRLIAGLQDKPDVRELCHLMLARLARLAGAIVVQRTPPGNRTEAWLALCLTVLPTQFVRSLFNRPGRLCGPVGGDRHDQAQDERCEAGGGKD